MRRRENRIPKEPAGRRPGGNRYGAVAHVRNRAKVKRRAATRISASAVRLRHVTPKDVALPRVTMRAIPVHAANRPNANPGRPAVISATVRAATGL